MTEGIAIITSSSYHEDETGCGGCGVDVGSASTLDVASSILTIFRQTWKHPFLGSMALDPQDNNDIGEGTSISMSA